ncbi:MAG: flavodoxin family protein [Candidatus Margulisbacteria bacterium]|jgi:multimeric flavodoxin WrbA|nr:flavodoxin family protein [Candidatus Margulisiibacteriota bacterium]
MKVILVNGSPHEKGCTYTALAEVAETLKKENIETEFFWLGNKPLSGCIACRSCAEKKRCVFDDRVNEFLAVAADFDGFIFGTPVHWAGASGALTSFLDRVFYADNCGGLRFFYLKPAAAVMSARRAGTTATYDQVNKYFGLMQMPIISSQYWNMVHGSTPEDVQKDLEGLQTMRTLARNMAFFLCCKEAGLQAGVPLPTEEKKIVTNFIR